MEVLSVGNFKFQHRKAPKLKLVPSRNTSFMFGLSILTSHVREAVGNLWTVIPYITMYFIFMNLCCSSDFAEPLQVGNSQKKQKTEQPVNEESLVMIQSMGFTVEQATKALRATVSII